MTVREFAHWQALYRLEPWQFDAGNLQFAALKQMVLAASPNRKPDGKVPAITDFVLDCDPEQQDLRTEEERAAELSAHLVSFFNDFNHGQGRE